VTNHDIQPRRLAVVLGASGGIGSVIAHGLADQQQRGWAVVVHHRSGHPPGCGVGAVKADLTNWLETRAMSRQIVDEWGPPDLLVNCAGRRDDGLLVAQSPDRWTSVLHDNVTAAYHPLRAFLPAMVRRREGCVVQLASVAGVVASPGQSAYSAAKAAVIALVRTAAVEYGSRGIRLNVIAPGFLETTMTDDVPAAVRATIESRQALPGTVSPEDILRLVLALADTPSLTGQVLRPDLGLSLST
jgi:3-oxoacyl-[acyl-carrier protein] reductase